MANEASDGVQRTSRNFKLVVLMAVVCFVLMVGSGVAVISSWQQVGQNQQRAELERELHERQERRAALQAMTIADFALVDQAGKVAIARDLDGHYTVLSFMFSHCTLACPIMSGNMYRLYLEGPAQVRFVSLSVDPVHDTPERLAEYAKNLGVSAPKWRMLSGPEKVVREVAASLGFDFQNDPATMIDMGDGRSMANIIHPTRLLLFGPDGRIIDSYSGVDRMEVDRLLMDLRTLPAVEVPGE